MRFGIVGLGRMGANIGRSAKERGHQVVVHDRDEELTARMASEGMEPAGSLPDLVSKLTAPRVVLVYVPHGRPTEQVCADLRELLDAGDVVIDAGNSHWQDSQRRHAEFAAHNIRFLDIGTSGGIHGARHGACFMAGGDRDAYELVRPLLEDLATDPRGALYVGEPGSGHFVKLIHNAIEFGMVQAIAEGVEMLQRSEFTLDLPALFDNWSHGSVIRSWLVELMRDALAENADFGQLSTYVEDTGEVKWVLVWALDEDIPSPVVSDSQQALMSYRDFDSPQAKAVALLRHAFGGHPVHRVEEHQPVRS